VSRRWTDGVVSSLSGSQWIATGLRPRDDKIGRHSRFKNKRFHPQPAEGLTRGAPFPQIQTVEIMEAVIYGMAGMSVGLIALVIYVVKNRNLKNERLRGTSVKNQRA
jgi:hypothetical protein